MLRNEEKSVRRTHDRYHGIVDCFDGHFIPFGIDRNPFCEDQCHIYSTNDHGDFIWPVLVWNWGVLADLVGMALFSKTAFFIGFTLNAFIEGAIYGFFFIEKRLLGKIRY